MKVDILKKDTILSDDRIRNRRISRIIKSLRDKYKLKDLLEYFDLPKSSYMYWQERLDNRNKDEELKETIEEYIEYYNKDRIKEKLGYLSPVEYREKNAA